MLQMLKLGVFCTCEMLVVLNSNYFALPKTCSLAPKSEYLSKWLHENDESVANVEKLVRFMLEI